MKIAKLVANQLGNPTGILSKVLAFTWNRRNVALNNTVFELLALEPTDRVLDIGFGGGYLLNRMTARVTNGWLVGVDISPAMVANGEKYYQTAIQSGRLDLKCAAVESLPYPDHHFTKVCSINSIFYWTDIHKGLREIRRVLVKDGLTIICFTDKGSIEKKGFAKEIKLLDCDEVERILLESGFEETKVLNFADQYRQYICITAEKPW